MRSSFSRRCSRRTRRSRRRCRRSGRRGSSTASTGSFPRRRSSAARRSRWSPAAAPSAGSEAWTISRSTDRRLSFSWRLWHWLAGSFPERISKMKTSRSITRFILLLFGVAAAATAASAGDPLALVPAGAASVGVIHLDQLRASPLSARLFGDADKLTADGDAARFMADADLSPKKDIDTVVVAGLPSSGAGNTPVIAIFQGRFDPDRLAAAAEARGAIRRTSPGGDYELLPEKGGKAPAAAAFVSRDLTIVGTESVVVDVLAARRSGLVGLTSGS